MHRETAASIQDLVPKAILCDLSTARRPAVDGASTRPRSRWSVPERQLKSVGEASVVTVVVQQFFPAITASDDVAVGTSELDAWRPRHNDCRSVTVRKPKIVSYLQDHLSPTPNTRTDPDEAFKTHLKHEDSLSCPHERMCDFNRNLRPFDTQNRLSADDFVDPVPKFLPCDETLDRSLFGQLPERFICPA